MITAQDKPGCVTRLRFGSADASPEAPRVRRDFFPVIHLPLLDCRE